MSVSQKARVAYISVDIEGVAGVVSPAQTLVSGFEYQQARHWMTQEAVSVCEGALAAGCDYCLVSDSHGGGENLLIDDFPRGTRIVRNWPRPLGMMQGVEEPGIHAAALVGYHSHARCADGLLAHTFAGRLISGLRVNGIEASETLVSAAIASEFGVPIALASGDAAYVEHARELLGSELLTVTTKQAHGRYSATSLHPTDAAEQLKTIAELAFSAPPTRLFELRFPAEIEVCFQRHIPAELLCYLDQFERVDGTTVGFSAPDASTLSKTLRFMTSVVFDEQLPGGN
ncbi:MAG: M55 family metallopeptidase, partial [Pseudomonadota bacterium]